MVSLDRYIWLYINGFDTWCIGLLYLLFNLVTHYIAPKNILRTHNVVSEIVEDKNNLVIDYMANGAKSKIIVNR
jgi:hypothetical protein